MSQIQQALPDREAVCIEYPGYIRSFEAALATLGGTAKVAQTFQGQKHRPLSLHFRPDDPLSHPLDGERQELSGCLLRFSRKASADRSASPAVSATIVARLTTSYNFTGIADFQYASSSGQAKCLVPEAVPEPFSKSVEPLICLPTRFSFVDAPVDYSFRSFYGEDPPEYKAGALSCSLCEILACNCTRSPVDQGSAESSFSNIHAALCHT